MRNFVELTKGAGRRQKSILLELSDIAEVCINMETGLWMRGSLTNKIAKNLLNENDKTIDEQIRQIEGVVLRNEKEALTLGVKLSGTARIKLNELYEWKKRVYGK